MRFIINSCVLILVTNFWFSYIHTYVNPLKEIIIELVLKYIIKFSCVIFLIHLFLIPYYACFCNYELHCITTSINSICCDSGRYDQGVVWSRSWKCNFITVIEAWWDQSWSRTRPIGDLKSRLQRKWEKINIEKFNDKNDFALWRMKIRDLMNHQGLEEAF